MRIVGIICEYNPLHLGHAKQIRMIRKLRGEDTKIVCLMSGNFVQRGEPAVFHKSIRARAALESGADLVLELPVTYALSSAENFARGGVRILGSFCDELCFGTETGDSESLMNTAKMLLSLEFKDALRIFLDQGQSFPAARQRALTQLGNDAQLLTSPNDILGVEYCKAILETGCRMKPFAIHREGNYHDLEADADNPSATALRQRIINANSIDDYVPTPLFRHAAVHTLAAGERAMLCRLRTMAENEFAAVPYGSEGLWRKLMHESRRQPDLESILTAVKSKRYTRTRLNRMVMCAFLGISDSIICSPAPYTRILGFNDSGREVLRQAMEHTLLYNVGQKVEDPFWDLEQRCADLYGLFALEHPDSPGDEAKQRVIYLKK